MSGIENVAADGTNRADAASGAGARLKRAVISVGLMITLAAISVANMPASTIKARLMVGAKPYLNVLGIGQSWGTFAPNPRSEVVYAGGRIAYSDGTLTTWDFPMRPGAMAYSDYRWQRFEEHIPLDGSRDLWQPFAQYLATHQAVPGKMPVQVALVRRRAQIRPPGATVALSPWSQSVYYVADAGRPR